MKSIAILCLATIIGSSQLRAADNPPDDFAEIKWGEGVDAAKAKMLLKPGVTFTTTSPDGSLLAFEGGTFATFPVARWELTFLANEFTKGRVDLKPQDTSRSALRQAYETLKKSITEKYRKAGREEHQRDFHSATYWVFTTRKGEWKIACDVNERTPGIFLQYIFNSASKPAGATKTLKKDI